MTRSLLLPLLALPLLACGDDGALDDEDGGGGGGATWVDGPDGRTFDASACGAVADAPEPIRCNADAAQRRVRLGLCGNLEADNTLDVFSPADRRDDVQLAVDGSSRIAAPLQVAGRYVATGGVTANNTMAVTGVFEVGQGWSVASPATIDGDALVAARIEASNTIRVTGTMQTPFAENAEVVDAGQTVVDDVTVGSALECDEAVDIAKLIASVKAEPGTAGLERLPGDLLEHVDQPSSLDVGCGNYVVTEIGADDTLDIHVVGPTVLVVTGDLRIAAPMLIDIEPGATLDLAIGGSLLVDNTLTIQSADEAAAWVGVAGEVRVAAPLHMSGVLVAPRSELNANNTVDVAGAILAKNLHVAAPIHVDSGPWLTGTGCVGSD